MLIKRAILPELEKHMSSPEITLITGPRQAGKTTLMEKLRDELSKKGEKTLLLNLDFEPDRLNFSSQERLLTHIGYEIGKGRGYVFIDEIQRKENAGIFLKGLYDRKLPYKFIVSGSGSLELKEKIHESLPGRKRIFELSTLSFEEFIDYKTDYKYVNESGDFDLIKFFELYPERGQGYLYEYLNFGGYPRVVLAESIEEKREIIQDIYRSFLEKDMTVLLNIKKTESLSNLVKIMASQIGNLVNSAEISRTLGLSKSTVKNFVWYLEKTYLIRKLTPFYKNIRKEITKSPVYYFYDLGMRNFSINRFENTQKQAEGFLLQNFIFNLLSSYLHKTATTLHFWRTKDKAEVDLVMDNSREVTPVEVKDAFLKRPEMSRSFRSFIEKYRPAKAFIVNLALSKNIQIEKTQVSLIPFYKTKMIVS